VSVAQHWDGRDADLMIALHARRSHQSIADFALAHPHRPLLLALTGTDLYRDIRTDTNAQESMALATRMIVLQELGLRELSPVLRRKTDVVLQSCEPIARRPVLKDCFEIVLSGHLREEKDPFRGAEALALLPPASRIRITHIGGARDPAYAREARRWMKREPRYRWLEELPRGRALATLARARALLISSRMEGGANVVSEALTAGVPVLASRIPGNVGLLGARYGGYFAMGDTKALARLMARTENSPEFLARLEDACRQRRPLVSRTSERRSLRHVIAAACRK
jgi:putative glycosyltransferase (TIGR04348 family)